MAANQERNFPQEAARLLLAANAATLATLDGAHPYAALVTPALDDAGDVLLLLSDLSAHTRHLRAHPACALLVVGPAPEANPQTAPRVTLLAEAAPTNDTTARAAFLQKHSYAELYAGFADFNLWRLILKDAHYVGGFAAAAKLDIAALRHEINAARGALPG